MLLIGMMVSVCASADKSPMSVSVNEATPEYFSVGNPIEYGSDKFYFAWSAHPAEIYYVQEYLPKGESFDSYKQMFTVSVILADLTPMQAVKAKIAELEERKKSDPVVNYVVAENDGEYILEFIVSDSKDDKMNCVEVDIHYYRQMIIGGKKSSVLSFYSVRAYGDDIIPFMQSIPDRRQKWYEDMLKLDLQPVFKQK